MKKYAFLILLLFFGSTNGRCQVQQAELELHALMEELKVVGLSVTVVKQEKIIYQSHVGLRDKAKGKPVNDSTIFRIASISKSFSATTVMQLIEAKKIKLSDDVGKWLGFTVRNPTYPNKVITVKMMLSHTSSINDSQGYFNLDVINPDKNPDWAKCFNKYKPGTNYEYCNLCYNMMGAVIENCSGERFDSRIKRHILDPLGIYGGYCIDQLDSNRFATLYEYDSTSKEFQPSPNAYAPRREEIKNYKMGYSTPIFSPTGGMKIGATDLTKYMMMHMNNGSFNGVKIMTQKNAKRMRKKISEEEGYGMAIRTATDLIPGKTLKGHTGSAYGLYSAMFFHPKEKFGFVVITNGCLPDDKHDIRDVLSRSILILYNNFIKGT